MSIAAEGKCWSIWSVKEVPDEADVWELKGVGMTIKAAMVGAGLLYADAKEDFALAAWDHVSRERGLKLKRLKVSEADFIYYGS